MGYVVCVVTNLAGAVEVIVVVLVDLNAVDITAAGRCVPVILVVIAPGVGIGVYVLLVCTNVTYVVIVLVNVCLLYDGCISMPSRFIPLRFTSKV